MRLSRGVRDGLIMRGLNPSLSAIFMHEYLELCFDAVIL